MRLFSDLGTPYSFRNMNGWGSHTYRSAIYISGRLASRSALTNETRLDRWVKADGSFVYVKLYAETMQGVGFSLYLSFLYLYGLRRFATSPTPKLQRCKVQFI